MANSRKMYYFRLSSLDCKIYITIVAFVILFAYSFRASNAEGNPSYFGAVTAFESLFLAAGSNLHFYRKKLGEPEHALIREFRDAAFDLYGNIGFNKTGGWLLQPGKFSQHPDYAFAGYTELPAPGSPKKFVKEIGMDVSHFLSKWPIIIVSLKEYYQEGSVERNYFERVEQGIVQQLLNKVVVRKNGSAKVLLLNNYMDGSNGVYRWNYRGRGYDYGYLPYDLSCTMSYSTLAFLENVDIGRLYEEFIDGLSNIRSYMSHQDVDYCFRISSMLHMRLSSKINGSSESVIGARELGLFNQSIEEVFGKQLVFTGVDAYRSVVGPKLTLMLAAFASGEEVWIEHFDRDIELMLTSTESREWSTSSSYHQLHGIFYASVYLKLSARYRHHRMWHSELEQYLLGYLGEKWDSSDIGSPVVSNTGWGEPGFKSIKSWVQWKTNILKQTPR